ncbi:MAG: tetratricopeptide repeat protein [Deltaproteobacteria bacterium]|nr:tetratricopeptide repeat protein [Deltaproteobacteria bacterium]
MDSYFISYSPVNGLDFAVRLCDALVAGHPSYAAWLDKRELRPGADWDEQIAEAIRTCAGLLFVMTLDSVEPQSGCKPEWTRALKYKKPIVPLLLDKKAEMPFRLGNRQHIDFTGEFAPALARLRLHLQWLASPAGQLQALKDRLADAQRDLRRASEPEDQGRIATEIAQLQQQIAEQQLVVDDPEGTALRVQESIARGLERERQPEKPISGTTRTKFINPPPALAPGYFQNRAVETTLINNFLKEESKRLLTIVGRAGIGKTALVCRVLKSLEGGQLPDDGGPLSVDGIVYLSAIGSRRVTFPDLYADLSRLCSDNTTKELEALYKDPRASTEAKMRVLLAAFSHGRVVVLLDNFEDVVDPATHNIHDPELGEALGALLNLPHHMLKIILTTRIAPRDLMLTQPSRQTRLELDKGLESPYAENILREMDSDGTVGLKTASVELLDEARQRTRGYPRALEALFAILSADRYTTLSEVLNDAEKLLPENVVEVLVGEAFHRLDPAAEQVMQALAVYARPVPAAAIDYLLQPYVLGVDSRPILNRLVTMHFARKEAERYYLHPVDQAYALSRVPEGDESDRADSEEPKFTRYALWDRAADYFTEVRKPREEWRTIDDLAPQLAEFELRCAGQDYETAASVLEEIGFDYLLLWGHNRRTVELHERLRDNLSDPWLKTNSAISLGIAYLNIGQILKAIDCFEQALDIYREIGNRQGEGAALGNLGNCYSALGQIPRAIDYHEQALGIHREIGTREGEGTDLGNLGNCYSALGQIPRAIDFYERALGISREIGNRQGEGADLDSLAQALTDEERYSEAVQYAMHSVQIGEEIGNPALGSSSNSTLALAHLSAGDLPTACLAAETARRYDEPWNNHFVLALLGVIKLRQGDRPTAQEAFTAAVQHAKALLTATAQNYAALETKGLALCGLVLCGKSDQLAEALEAYRAARAINQDPGIVGRALRLFDALALADSAEVLAQVRTVASGK